MNSKTNQQSLCFGNHPVLASSRQPIISYLKDQRKQRIFRNKLKLEQADGIVVPRSPMTPPDPQRI